MDFFAGSGSNRRESESALAASILDCLNFGLGVVDETGRLSFANQCLRDASLHGSGVKIAADGRMYFSRPDPERKFRSTLAEIITGSRPDGSAWTYGCDGDMPDGTVVIRPLGGAAALVIVAPRTEEFPAGGGRTILEPFGLTAAEHRLTSFLASGGRLAEAADSFGVSRHTVGNQLRSIFEKTGVTRQTDLLRLIWSGGFVAALA
jgi:DNA-binding CsgD family transcriptional regulator